VLFASDIEQIIVFNMTNFSTLEPLLQSRPPVEDACEGGA
jgi:hypothetical protein